MAAAYAVACFGKYFDDRGVVLQTENEGVAHFAQKLYRRCGVQGTVISKERPTGPVYEFSVKDPDEVAKMLALFGHTGKEPTLRIRPEKLQMPKLYAGVHRHGVSVLRHDDRPRKEL